MVKNDILNIFIINKQIESDCFLPLEFEGSMMFESLKQSMLWYCSSKLREVSFSVWKLSTLPNLSRGLSWGVTEQLVNFFCFSWNWDRPFLACLSFSPLCWWREKSLEVSGQLWSPSSTLTVRQILDLAGHPDTSALENKIKSDYLIFKIKNI